MPEAMEKRIEESTILVGNMEEDINTLKEETITELEEREKGNMRGANEFKEQIEEKEEERKRIEGMLHEFRNERAETFEAAQRRGYDVLLVER